jgi:hypothetical protein
MTRPRRETTELDTRPPLTAQEQSIAQWLDATDRETAAREIEALRVKAAAFDRIAEKRLGTDFGSFHSCEGFANYTIAVIKSVAEGLK